MKIDNNKIDHDEIMSLLPWFVNRTLDKRQSETVSDHLEHCEECQNEMLFLKAMKDTVQSDAQANYMDSTTVDKDLHNVMARIDANESEVKAAGDGGFSLQQVIQRFIDYLPTIGLQGATAIAAVLVTVIGFQVYYGQSDSDYSVLSSSEISEPSVRMAVEVASTIDQDEVRSTIQSVLEKHVQKSGIEKGVDGGYIIMIQDATNIEELNALVIDLNNQESIERVEILP